MIDNDPELPLNIITSVRDPIAVRISGFFEMVKVFQPELLEGNKFIDPERTLAFLRDKILAYDTSTDIVDTYFREWFSKELGRVFGIDIYSHPFDHSRGFTVITQRNIRLLIVRLEDIDSCFEDAVSVFLGLERPVPVVRSNIADVKWYSQTYDYLRKNIRIPREVCQKIYSFKYAKHFYSPEEIERFIAKWSHDTR
jgi:hypothetical protein